MADGKIIIDTQIDTSGAESGLKKTEQSAKASAAKLASEYRKMGMSASEAFTKAWSEIERTSKNGSEETKRAWSESSNSIADDFSRLGQTARKGLQTVVSAAAKVFAVTEAALGVVGGYAIKVGTDFESGMSEVAAISGATADQLGKLTDKAKEMGAKTKFSATESAAAFKYMAMAGWQTEDMLSGIEGVMNLAAASGEDLAAVSDIVTDALTAFGLQASDSAHFADVLAKASSNSNTNVGLMGATFKYVAPLAGAMGYSIEDTAATIGLMANAGIKGEQAGTALRAMLTRLSDPPKDAAEAMDDLGISLTNTDGTMKPLSATMDDLRDAFSGLSEKQKIEYASSLAGQEAMSGLLAIVNAAPEDYEKLTAAIADSGGAAQEAAKTMQDNLKGAVEELMGGLETLSLSFYETFADDLKAYVKKGTSYVDDLTEAFDKGGLLGVVEKSGDIFADLAAEAAKQAPKMVNASIKFIESFAKGLVKNRSKIVNAAGDFVKTLADTFIRLLPKELQKPVKKAVDAMIKTLTGGGLKKALGKVENLFKSLSKVIGNLSKMILPPLTKAFDFCVNHLDLLIAALASGVAAFKAYQIVKNVSTWLNTASASVAAFTAAQSASTVANAASTASLTLGQAAYGVLTGQIGIATAAQTLFNTACSANPIGLLITAVAGLAAGIGVLAAATSNAEEDLRTLEVVSEEYSQKLSGVTEAMKSYQDQVNAAGSTLDGFNESIIVSSEKQQELAEKMDSVQAQITEIARIATEERRSLTADEIQRMDELFEQMRAMAEQELQISQSYQEAVTMQAETLAQTHQGSIEEYEAYAAQIAATAEDQRVNTVTKANEQYTEELALLQQKHEAAGTMNSEAFLAERDALQKKYQDNVEAANQECADTNAILAAGYNQRATDLQDYINTVDDCNKQRRDAEERHNRALKDLQKKYNAQYDAENDMYIAGRIDETDEFYREMNDLNCEYEEELADILDKENASFTEAAQDQAGVFMIMCADAESYGGQLTTHCQTTANGCLDAFERMPDEATATMQKTMQGMMDGMASRENSLYEKASSIASSIIGRLKKIFDIHSPSRVMKKLFGQVIEGGEIGLEKEAPKLMAIADNVSSSLLERFSQLDVSAVYQKLSGAVASQRAAMARIGLARLYQFEKSESQHGELIDYARLANLMVEAFAKAGLTFSFNEREVARMVRGVL